MTTTTFKNAEIRKMNLAQLKETAIALDVVFDEQVKKVVLLEAVLAANSQALGCKMPGDVELTERSVTALEQMKAGTLSKSKTFQILHEEGISTAQISRETGAHYSFVHTTLNRIKMSAASQAALDEVTRTLNELEMAVKKTKEEEAPSKKKSPKKKTVEA